VIADQNHTRAVEQVVRSLATAARALRLYPPSSPIPAQSLEATEKAVNEALAEEDVLCLNVRREGLSWQGEPLGKHTPGSTELADELRSHGVAEIDFVGAGNAGDIALMLAQCMRDPADVVEQGGFTALLVSQGVESIRVGEVQLTVVDTHSPGSDESVEDFLRSLASNPDRLGAWMTNTAAGDPTAFEEGLAELVELVGPDAYDGLLATLSKAFAEQPQETRDVMLRLALDDGPVRSLVGDMRPIVGAEDLAAALVNGSLGLNMLSLSNALAKLPLEDAVAEVREKVQARLRKTGHTDTEAAYLDHMLTIRARFEPEPPVSDSDQTYQAVARASVLRDEDVRRARDAVVGSIDGTRVVGVKTMLCLLDHEDDFELFCATATNLGAMVPQLLQAGELTLSAEVLQELAAREIRATGPWPELSARLRDAIAGAVGPDSMGILVQALTSDPALLPAVQEIIRHAGESAGPSLVSAAIAEKGPGLEIAEQLVGRRIIDLLNAEASGVPWYQLGAVVARLAREGDARSMQTIEGLLKRPDEQSRREVIAALAASPNPAALALIAKGLRDPSPEVSMIAARALGRSAQPAAVVPLANRLAEIDGDAADFLLGKEIIGALARIPGTQSEDALRRLATKRSLVRRGRIGELQDIAKRALEYRQTGGAA
jgi:hypothetical protein